MIERFGGEFEPIPEEGEKGSPGVEHSSEELDEFESALDALFTMSDDDFFDVLKKLDIQPNPQKKPLLDTQAEASEEDF